MSFVLASTPLFFICDEVGKFNKWDKLNNEKRKILMSVLKEEGVGYLRGKLRKCLARTYIDLHDEEECFFPGFALSWNCLGTLEGRESTLGERLMKAEWRRIHEKFIIRKISL